jgi:hypothetical protein
MSADPRREGGRDHLETSSIRDSYRSLCCNARSRNQWIQVKTAVVDRLGAMRRPGGSYSDVILGLTELEAHGTA